MPCVQLSELELQNAESGKADQRAFSPHGVGANPSFPCALVDPRMKRSTFNVAEGDVREPLFYRISIDAHSLTRFHA